MWGGHSCPPASEVDVAGDFENLKSTSLATNKPALSEGEGNAAHTGPTLLSESLPAPLSTLDA